MDFSLGDLAQAIANALGTTITNLVSPIPQHFTEWMGLQLQDLWDNIWNSGANLLATPLELTLNYPPAREFGAALLILVYGLTGLSVCMLALRVLWRSFSTNTTHEINDALNGTLMGILLGGSSVLIVGQAYAITWLAGNAFGRFNYTPSFAPKDVMDVGPGLVLGVVTVIVLFYYGWRLMVRAAYRLILLMFLTPLAPVMGIIYGIPQIRWVALAYFKTLGGWLIGGVLSVGAASLGVQLITGADNPIEGLVFSVALFSLAYDLMPMLAVWGSGRIDMGHIPSPSGALAALGGFVAGGAVGAAAGGAAGGAAASGGSAAIGAGAIGALPVGAIGPGYD